MPEFDQETENALAECSAPIACERFPRASCTSDQYDVLTYTFFHTSHWSQIRSTNPHERLNREVKRRANVAGSFPSEASIVRLVGAILLEQNRE
jgi:putative transposase